ncbi:hypothetical protein NU688_26990 [Variovorax sp. ZS18.2.2]|uniref:hypothetical protein n=1 Tax=Variovorax sp. ZS18.2.2 TaxID=2971255 RepID=UPI002151A798|nr:hypothetical protein [Variovorax sp. ZS18.2.2]MCR6479830.1 hypothetical protein [Variovorax sp. ZS18.2.2]
MPVFFKKLFDVLNADLTGRSSHKEVGHPYFEQLVYFAHRDTSKCYWEAELQVPGSDDRRISVTMNGTAQGPDPAAEAFCRAQLADLDGLFLRCRPVFEPEFVSWATQQPFPSAWRTAFQLDGFTVPAHGDVRAAWDATFLFESAGRYFTAFFESGTARRVQVDG